MASKYPRNVVEMSLGGIAGEGPWSKGRKHTERIVTVTLIWPRPLIASRVAVQTHTFTQDGLDLSSLDWSEKVLFKESVEGPFGIVVQVSQSMTAQQITRVAGAIGEAVLKAAGSEAARMAIGPGLKALAKFPFTFMAGELSGLGQTPDVVAAGRTTLLPGKTQTLEIPLFVPEDIVKQTRNTRAGRTQPRNKTMHKQGESAGRVLLDLTYYRD